jgi:hypothetical protein
MKKIRLAILALGVTAFLSFCISTGSRDGAGAKIAENNNPTISMISN